MEERQQATPHGYTSFARDPVKAIHHLCSLKAAKRLFALLNIQTDCASSMTPFRAREEDKRAGSQHYSVLQCEQLCSRATHFQHIGPLFHPFVFPSALPALSLVEGGLLHNPTFSQTWGQNKCDQRRLSYPGPGMQSIPGSREGKTNPGPYAGPSLTPRGGQGKYVS